MKKFLVFALCFLMIFSLAACAPSGNNGGDDEAKGDTTIDVCFASEPDTIDPALNSAVDGAIILQHAFEGLIKWEDDGKGNAILKPGMAESWDISEDKTVYTFHIRKDAVWSDGEPVTAKDFLYAWQRLADPATAADYCYMLDPVKGYDSTIKGQVTPDISAPDDYTFIVNLDVPCSYFEEICAFPAVFPVRQDIIEAHGDQWTMKPETYVGNGPYKMKEWEHNSYILFEKDDSYYDADSVIAPEIKFHLMDDANAIYAGFQSGDLDFIESVPVDEIPQLIESGNLKVADYLGTYYVCFQTQKAPFDNPKVREAFSLTIDRQYIVDQICADGSVAASGYVPAGISDAGGPGTDFRKTGGDYYDIASDTYKANCDKARELLAEAGFPGGAGFPVVEYLYNTDARHKAIAEALQNMWQNELGVQVTLANQDWAVFLDERKEGHYSVARNGWISDYNDPMSFLDMWVTGGGNNDAQYANPDYDALIGAAKLETDPAKRMKLMHDAEDILLGEDSVVAPIFYYVQTYMEDKNLKGWYYTPLGYFFFKGATITE